MQQYLNKASLSTKFCQIFNFIMFDTIFLNDIIEYMEIVLKIDDKKLVRILYLSLFARQQPVEKLKSSTQFNHFHFRP